MLITWGYRVRNSIMERIDSRARWIFSLIFLFSITMFWDARFLFFFFILGFTWYSLANVKWAEARRAWLTVSMILFTMIVVNTIITGGGAGGIVPEGGTLVWPQGFTMPITGWTIHFGLTYERLWFALCQILRILPISAVFIIIPFSMDPRLYGVTFKGLGLPDKVAYTMELAFRYVPTLARDFNLTMDAQKARGYELERMGGSLLQQIVRIAPLLVPVTMNSIITGEDVTNAMDLRCFGTHKRTWLIKLVYRKSDYLLIAFSVLLIIASFILTAFLGVGEFTVPSWFLTMVGAG
jgi:energy-coupling factor transport system permease protein